jgi:hypothetical protein
VESEGVSQRLVGTIQAIESVTGFKAVTPVSSI